VGVDALREAHESPVEKQWLCHLDKRRLACYDVAMTTTMIGTPDPDPDDETYEALAAAYRRERKEAEKSIAKALYVPLTWVSKYKPR
jgi:hypothetical protein